MRYLAFLAALLFGGAAFGRTVLQIPTESESRVQMQVESCFSQLPSSGYAPVEVVINNSSTRPRTWNLRFSSPAWNMAYATPENSEQVHYSTSVTVEAGAARTFKLLAPLSTSNEAATLGVTVTGYGLPNGAQQFFPMGSRTGKPLMPCMAVSGVASATGLGGRLEQLANDFSQQAYAVNFQADEMPDDWRALAGFAAIWIMENEWDALMPPQRTALEDWVATGGKLFLCAKGVTEHSQVKGIGTIASVDPNSIDAAHLKEIFQGGHTVAPAARWGELMRSDTLSVINDDFTHWASGKEMGVLRPNLPLLIGFLAIFATVVGPVNLFVFAKEGRRSRIFWTVPLISICATFLLFVLIIVQDGFGGWGIRTALICLVPSARKAVVFQEQISRTGMLGSAAFTVRDPAWMTMVNLGHPGRARRDARSVQNAGTRFDEDWFKSRSLQSQWIESVIPTRAEVALVNPDEAREGRDVPVIVSSIATPLSKLWFWDSSGVCWQGTNVKTGVKTSLSRGPAPAEMLPEARIPLRRRMAAFTGARGNFVAFAEDADSFIGTLRAIRWQNRRAVYAGPMTGAELSK